MRPSIIQGNYTDPFMGWTDTISASGFQLMMVALGVLHYLHIRMETVLDFIPCDFVSNQIIAQTVYTATHPAELNVIHATTSAKNPLSMEKLAHAVLSYCRYNPFYAKPSDRRVWWQPVPSKPLWQMATYMSLELPLVMVMNYHRLRGDERKFQQF